MENNKQELRNKLHQKMTLKSTQRMSKYNQNLKLEKIKEKLTPQQQPPPQQPSPDTQQLPSSPDTQQQPPLSPDTQQSSENKDTLEEQMKIFLQK